VLTSLLLLRLLWFPAGQSARVVAALGLRFEWSWLREFELEVWS
jgi:hypothetical protein